MKSLIVGDCLTILPSFPADFVDMVLTDPPWNISKCDVGHAIETHRRLDRLPFRKGSLRLSFDEWDTFENLTEYLEFTEAWMKECFRVLKPHGHCVVWFAEDWISYLNEIAKRLGYQVRGHLYWLKANPTPRAFGVSFRRALEHASWFTKYEKRGATFNRDLPQQPNYVKASVPIISRIHPAQKPVKVLRVWIRYMTKPGELVLDPFAGSGSTGIAAFREGRNYILIERTLIMP